MEGGVPVQSYLHRSVETPFTGCRPDQIESLGGPSVLIQGFPVDYPLEFPIVEHSTAPMPGSSPLVALIRDCLHRHGPMPFPWFMQQALYHPELGYYTSTRLRIGRQGDYYTNVSVGRLYGELLGSQLIEMWKLVGSSSPFTIVEEGAEDGQMAIDILTSVADESIEAAGWFDYVIVEPIPQKQQQQRARFEPALLEKVRWVTRVDEIEPVTGAFISNELVDSMPVHIVTYCDNQWSELLVDFSGNDFFFIPAKVESPELVHALGR